ncbi:PEP-CTERM sorting domain-containing protein [Roseateles violae]|uniref:PEP-CTERM sorting domain-containing protein n=1 Tax=Roseateles violae TaxID=3058042 RepID=A0ABT8DZB4_9BURK|nr:PEP-CTERM sorting domain-containing protein [Pelomonas sp. PFR6]MDN3922937.1 PEP-CTERM sorting domain-containing protein [Pelomonas sp. PFR6]
MRNMRPLNQPYAAVRRWPVRLGAAVAAILLSGTSQQAAADLPDTLGPAHIYGELAFNFPPKLEATIGEWVLISPEGHSKLRLDSAILPSPYLEASAVIAHEPYTGRVVATADYEFMVVGPEASPPVRVDMTVAGRVVADADIRGAFSLKSTWALDSSLGGRLLSGGIETPTLQSHYNDEYHETAHLAITPNSRIKVSMFVDVFIAAGGGPGGSAYALVDPVFAFGPGVGPEYSFAFSPGVGNLPLVPEPHSFILMSAGLLVLGWRIRRASFAPQRAVATASDAGPCQSPQAYAQWAGAKLPL